MSSIGRLGTAGGARYYYGKIADNDVDYYYLAGAKRWGNGSERRPGHWGLLAKSMDALRTCWWGRLASFRIVEAPLAHALRSLAARIGKSLTGGQRGCRHRGGRWILRRGAIALGTDSGGGRRPVYSQYRAVGASLRLVLPPATTATEGARLSGHGRCLMTLPSFMTKGT
jgi:hypothetical protein